MGATEVVEDVSEIGRMCTDVLGAGWNRLRLAHLATADRVGIELFEFDGNYAPENNLDFRRHGVFHFCVQDPDIEGLTAKVVAPGGKQRMPIRAYYPGEKPYKMVYVEDPFGNVFQIYSHSYELTYSQGAYV